MIHRGGINGIDHEDILRRHRRLNGIFLNVALIPFFNRVIHIYRPDEEMLRPEPFGKLPEIAAERKHDVSSMQLERLHFIPFAIMGACFRVFLPAFRDAPVSSCPRDHTSNIIRTSFVRLIIQRLLTIKWFPAHTCTHSPVGCRNIPLRSCQADIRNLQRPSA